MKSESKLLEIRNELESAGATSLFSFDIIDYIKNLSHKWAAVVVFFILWEILPTIGVVDPTLIPAPSTIAMTLWDPTLSRVLPMDTVISLFKVFSGLGIALAVAIPLGYLLGGFFKDFEKAVDPLLELLGQLNPWSFFHLAIVFLGIGELSIIAVVFYISMWPVLYNTITGVKNVDPAFVKVARAVGMGKFDIFWRVQLPASMSTVFAGI